MALGYMHRDFRARTAKELLQVRGSDTIPFILALTGFNPLL
jgi:hypothetical protein